MINQLNIVSVQKDIDTVLVDYHTYLHEVLPKLEKLLVRVQRRHKSPDEYQKKIVQIMHVIRAELSAHLFKEEETLFPMIIELMQEIDPQKKIVLAHKIIVLTDVMTAEHEGLESLLSHAKVNSDNINDDIDDFNDLKRALEKITENVEVHSKFEDKLIFLPLINYCESIL